MEFEQYIIDFLNLNNNLYTKVSSKIIIRVNLDKCMFSIKNDSNEILKHRKLELLGGNMDVGVDKDTHEALVRELMEEESSHFLSEKARKEATKLDSIVIQGKKGMQLYNVYIMDISTEEYNKIKNNFLSIESFGFVLLKTKNIIDRKWFGKNRAMFTPKTNILFSSMSLSGSEFFKKLKS